MLLYRIASSIVAIFGLQRALYYRGQYACVLSTIVQCALTEVCIVHGIIQTVSCMGKEAGF